MGKIINKENRRILLRAIDMLSLLIPTKHSWTKKERRIYEETIKVLNAK